MPELPEVESVARGLKELEGAGLIDLRIVDSKVWFESKLDPKRFHGKTLLEVSRRGKYLLLRFSQKITLIQHLRMTGKMLEKDSSIIPDLVKADLKKGGPKAVQARAIFQFSNGKEVVFFDPRRFGTLTAVSSEENFFAEKKIAPDPLLETDRAKEVFLRGLQSDRALKAVLLDQSVVAGVGNIYADEALFRMGAHPLLSARRWKAKDELWNVILQIFQSAILSGGSSIQNYVDSKGNVGSFSEQHLAYGRKDLPCVQCGKIIRTITVASRTTHFCPRCQRLGKVSFDKK